MLSSYLFIGSEEVLFLSDQKRFFDWAAEIYSRLEYHLYFLQVILWLYGSMKRFLVVSTKLLFFKASPIKFLWVMQNLRENYLEFLLRYICKLTEDCWNPMECTNSANIVFAEANLLSYLVIWIMKASMDLRTTFHLILLDLCPIS